MNEMTSEVMKNSWRFIVQKLLEPQICFVILFTSSHLKIYQPLPCKKC